MGNFSRSTFDGLKHYVSVRLQQGVPLVDADWNEQDDIRRFELENFIRWFVGNGVPEGNTGFQIVPVNADNDFLIKGGDGTWEGAGRCLVDGWEVLIEKDVNYTQQLGFNPSQPLQPPQQPRSSPVSRPISRNDTVYLDTWIQEMNATNDTNLINQAIGIETCVRLKRQWAVRVEVGGNGKISPQFQIQGHRYYPLAIIRRTASKQRIEQDDITDLRRVGFKLANLKVPIFVQKEETIIDSDRFAELLENSSKVFRDRMEKQAIFAKTEPEANHDRTIVYLAIQHILQICSTGRLQAKMANLNNGDALEVLRFLATAQKDFLSTIEKYGNRNSFFDDFSVKFSSKLTTLDNYLRAGSLIDACRQQTELITSIAVNSMIANQLKEITDRLLSGAEQVVYQKFPNLNQADPSDKIAFKQGSRLIWEGIIDSLERNDSAFIDDSLKKSFTPAASSIRPVGKASTLYIEVLKYIKANLGLSTELANEVNSYIDYTTNKLIAM